MEKQETKKRVGAILLSLLICPGAGHLYLGDKKKGYAFLLGVAIILLVLVFVVEKELFKQAQGITDPTLLLTSVSLLAQKALEAHQTLVRIGIGLILMLWIAAPLDLLIKK